ncbi:MULTISPECIES: vitamin K epoxide reductase family protein [Streptomyces]|uniref:vitamin K epoxide reductase family protein n=1 Tax=Streptomyces TaxID=1883 RepID=UPI0033D4FB46
MDRERSGVSARQARPRPGVGRPSSAAAERISDDLRLGSGDFLEQRRLVAALNVGATAAYTIVALYQFGLLRRLPEPPLPGVDAERVDASGEAYALLRTPDAALGLTSAGITLLLAGMGGRRRHRDHPWAVLAAAAKAVGDAGMSVVLFTEQLTKHRRVCSWCTVAAACHLAAVPPLLTEAAAALRTVKRRKA